MKPSTMANKGANAIYNTFEKETKRVAWIGVLVVSAIFWAAVYFIIKAVF